MVRESDSAHFPGFPDFQANVTFVPIQFFTVVLPNSSRGCARIVGYMLRKILGWVDRHGNPTQEQLQVSYAQLIREAGVSRDAIADALKEAVEKHFLNCVRAPQPSRPGESAQTGVYELCWDNDGPYTDSIHEFRGFYFPEAALIPVREGDTVVRRPKAARKNIPNAFFDWLLPRERLSVTRVVGTLLFYSIQWGYGGERKVPVTLSITELSRLNRFSRHHVHEAVTEAAERGYLEQIDPGHFDTNAGQQSRAATYRIRWLAKTPVTTATVQSNEVIAVGPLSLPVGKGEPGRSEIVNGAPVEKGAPGQSEKGNGERSEKVDGIKVKKESKTHTATGALPVPLRTTNPTAAAAGYDLLLKAGFDHETALRLAQKCSVEVITCQIDWLPGRNATRNRLGLLRRAIEQNWPKPDGQPAADSHAAESALGLLFARNYYAAYHDCSGESVTEPFAKDVRLAGKLVERLLALTPDESQIPNWGRSFGRMLRTKHQRETNPRPHLSAALVLYGDEFLRTLQKRSLTRQRDLLGQARVAHQEFFEPRYLNYVQTSEQQLKQRNPALYGKFVEQRQATRHNMSGGMLVVSADMLTRFDSDSSRLHAFAEFFHRHPEFPVLGFWEWDKQANPQRFAAPASKPTPEVHV